MKSNSLLLRAPKFERVNETIAGSFLFLDHRVHDFAIVSFFFVLFSEVGMENVSLFFFDDAREEGKKIAKHSEVFT